jgi:putative PIN family toxin of toxin-antitoxin system
VFYDFAARAEILLANIEERAIVYFPRIKLDIISDKNDNMIIELADASSADFIITGNTTDFTFSHYKTTKIVTPREYWMIYQE